ncbi:MAG: hypothetical protein IPI02_03975 [Sterolibacteriaceae bacterium]|nr:hypothetical protein [Sterolibacteriaceae bacterium]
MMVRADKGYAVAGTPPLVGYADFTRLCRVNDPGNWQPGLRLESDGVYVDVESISGANLFHTERSELLQHPKKDLTQPILSFPCSLRELQTFLEQVGAYGCIDPFDMADWISASMVQSSPVGRWPWGSYETDLLRILAAAAERYWVRYDPSDRTTAQKSDDVANWIKEHHVGGKPVAERVAQIMAQILRADGLPTGPRK